MAYALLVKQTQFGVVVVVVVVIMKRWWLAVVVEELKQTRRPRQLKLLE